ncbi:MAG: fluoride efflux transporter CrcB [Desulfovibrionaceae bacterium]|nr:fluoride efflux transporter CrcB [Desulfovibrionaceae bacterium]
MVKSILAISAGASLGALLRWGLGHLLNEAFPPLFWGTLAANLLGGYLMGAAVCFFSGNPHVSPELRLFAITGFLGALTTFSSFSAEVSGFICGGRIGLACGTIGLHVIGSLLMTFLGMASFRLLFR